MNRLNWYIHASIEFHLNFDVSIFPDGYLPFLTGVISKAEKMC